MIARAACFLVKRKLLQHNAGISMTHPLETIIRQAYAAFGRGDIDGYLAPCTEDFTFHVPGNSGISGAYAGREGLYDLAGKAMTITGGTFHEEVEDVLANDNHAVVLARHRFTRNGSLKEHRTAHVYQIKNGKLAQCFEQAQDPASFDEAWGPSSSVTNLIELAQIIEKETEFPNR